jgi:hypothetical protein
MAATGPSDVPSASAPGAGTPPSGTAGPDWTDQVVGLLVDTVDKVRSRTTGPVLNVAHAAVYGVVAALVAIPVVILLLIGAVRLLNWAVPGDVWIVYAILAVLFWLTGFILWSKRNQRA